MTPKAQRIVEALKQRDDLLFDVASAMARCKVAGPWTQRLTHQDTTTFWERKAPNTAIVARIWQHNTRYRWIASPSMARPGIPFLDPTYADQGDTDTLHEAQALADLALDIEGWTLTGGFIKPEPA